MDYSEHLILKIVQAGAPVLRQRAREMTIEEIRDPSTKTLIELMRNTMRDAPGVGLAAPQVGLGIRLIVIEDLPEYQARLSEEQLRDRRRQPIDFHVLINPVLTIKPGSKVEHIESCLSLEGLVARVPRALRVKVEALDDNGNPISIDAEGWYARILQHEIDHLEGNLYVDNVDSNTLMNVEYFTRYSSC